MTAAKQEWNDHWDKVVKPNATPLKEAENGQMYQLDSTRLVVLNGNYHQMGRQYGLLLRDDLMKMRDLMKAQMITSGIMTYDELKSAVGEPFYQAKPRRQKELLRGVQEATGIDLMDLAIMDETYEVSGYERIVGGAGGADCSSLAVWGDMSRDGKVYTGRNFDFDPAWRNRFPDLGVVLVLNPEGSDFAIAGPAMVGVVSSLGDMMNSGGLFLQTNNADVLLGNFLFSKEQSIFNVMTNVAIDYASLEEMDQVVPGAHANHPMMWLSATADEACYYEMDKTRAIRCAPEEPGITARANNVMAPEWGFSPKMPDRVGLYSPLRRGHFFDHFKQDPSTNDEVKMRKYLNKEMWLPDGTISDGSASILGSFPNGEVTVWQVVSKPADLMMWIRFPTKSAWLELDLKQYFKKM